MLYADLDNLKMINDTFGHQEGDKALSDIAAILKSTFRDSDIVARIGGDEFAVLPIGTGGNNIEKITGRLQKNLQSHNENKGCRYILSISFGIACYDPACPCSIDELLAQGDAMMYRQKKLKKQA
jgi:diguanylate cyclase (GGDEF)-like protein